MAPNSFSWPLINNNITESDKQVLIDFLSEPGVRLTNGPKVREFENLWSTWLGVKYSVMVGSGAAANYITTSIVRELKGQRGEIIVPTIGWVSDISSVINTGFVPVFVDVDIKTMAISTDNIRRAITEKTKAIVLVHALGFNGLKEDMLELAREHNLLLIEDCCEAHGAIHNGQRVGSVGDMSCFSFYFGHHITTIEGGMVCTNDPEVYELARMFRSHGMTREASPHIQERYAAQDLNPLFTFAVPGYNMRSTELNAVLGIEQMNRIDSNIEHRQRNLNTWLNNLDSQLYFTDFITEGNSNFALPLLIRSTRVLMNTITSVLEKEGVEYRLGTAGGGNQARQPYLKSHEHRISGNLVGSNYIHEQGLYVGNHTDLTEAQIIKLCKELNNV